MLLKSLFVLTINWVFLTVTAEEVVPKKDYDAHGVFNSYLTPTSKMKTSSNTTSYFEQGENVLRVPKISITGLNSKKKKVKKSPKRTIQKIIKKSKSRSRKIYLNQATNPPTQLPQDNVNDVEKEALNQEPSTLATLSTQKKKNRKWGLARGAFQTPFQKLQPRKEVNINPHRRNIRQVENNGLNMSPYKVNKRQAENKGLKININQNKGNKRETENKDLKININQNRRNKREAENRDLYILQDLDEAEIFTNEDGNDIVNAHIKKYW